MIRLVSIYLNLYIAPGMQILLVGKLKWVAHKLIGRYSRHVGTYDF